LNGNFMTSDIRDVRISRVHSGAICREIGERFRASHGGDGELLPQALRMLIDRFAKAEIAASA
jgi:hypothetical protein